MLRRDIDIFLSFWADCRSEFDFELQKQQVPAPVVVATRGELAQSVSAKAVVSALQDSLDYCEQTSNTAPH
jgi:hypothetical protein